MFLTRRSFVNRQYPPRIAAKIRVEWLLEKSRCISMLDVWDFISALFFICSFVNTQEYVRSSWKQVAVMKMMT